MRAHLHQAEEWEVAISRKRSLDWGQQRNPLNKVSQKKIQTLFKNKNFCKNVFIYWWWLRRLPPSICKALENFDYYYISSPRTPHCIFTDPCLKTLVLNHYTIHVICGSINAFPGSYIRSPWHRFMSEKRPHFKLAQVCACHPPQHSLFLVIFGNIYKRDTEPEIYSRAAFRQRKSAPVTGCDHSLSLPLFFILSFFTDQSNFRLSERAEGSWWGL